MFVSKRDLNVLSSLRWRQNGSQQRYLRSNAILELKTLETLGAIFVNGEAEKDVLYIQYERTRTLSYDRTYLQKPLVCGTVIPLYMCVIYLCFCVCGIGF